MPLVKGNTPAAIGANISELVTSGHAPAQAAAIAYNVATGEDRAAGIAYRCGESILLILRAATAGDFPHTWGFPCGHIEAGETPEQAAIRESQEEIGYTTGDPLAVLDWDNGVTTYGVNVPAPFVPVLNSEHVGYVWAPLSALPQPLHPGVALTIARLPACGVGMDARIVDGNGWFEVKANPISKAGIFPYSGRQLGKTGADADRIYRVLRPAEELSDPACIESFKLIPWIDDHTMLGPTAQAVSPNAVSAEKKGVQGVIGEDVFFEGDTLFANIKAFSSTLAQLIQAGKRELSAGYRCIYDMTAGVLNGQHYDAVQRKIRGNHLALVTEGRMGPDVAVMDRLTFTFDALEIDMAGKDEASGTGAGAMTLEQACTMIAELAPQVAKLTEAMAGLNKPAAPAAVEDKPAAPAAPAADATPPAAAPSGEGEKAVAPAAAMSEDAMEQAVIGRIAKRDTLAKQLSGHVGTFDHSDMTLDKVVAYGIEKLGLKVDKGQEFAALSGYLQAKPDATPSATVTGMDAAHKPAAGNFVAKHLGAK